MAAARACQRWAWCGEGRFGAECERERTSGTVPSEDEAVDGEGECLKIRV